MRWARHVNAILCGLLAAAIAGTALAQSATGGAAGIASGAGNYGFSGSRSSASQGNGQIGATGGVANSTVGTGSYTTFGPAGLPQGMIGLPPVGGPPVGGASSATGSTSGLGNVGSSAR